MHTYGMIKKSNYQHSVSEQRDQAIQSHVRQHRSNVCGASRAGGKPDMEFRMHKSRLHYFDPRDSEFIFVNTVSENKAGFTKR
jgi:hypothetical protein